MKKEKYLNPMLRPGLTWMWILLFPLALILYVHYDLKEDRRKREEKRRLKEEAFEREYPDFEMWVDDDDA